MKYPENALFLVSTLGIIFFAIFFREPPKISTKK
uniref:Photosystem II protein T n=1 Tax=Plantago ovata TaxID=185002 RepID=A0A4P8JFQ9_PLAOV|nr:photosystem II protein T [Plantago ovata]